MRQVGGERGGGSGVLGAFGLCIFSLLGSDSVPAPRLKAGDVSKKIVVVRAGEGGGVSAPAT